ncbi:hypothetical protein HPB50_013482 [Hyalomma asiaticum]|uniref:Uncharacterized protein n=1 Tax=Hyalomma asiaticum TaxID=266040 RepID=A0ACB7RNZ0_HYAAI|nr:hypothetical protein HPB50_013482 [Hyalomma asiaticum]
MLMAIVLEFKNQGIRIVQAVHNHNLLNRSHNLHNRLQRHPKTPLFRRFRWRAGQSPCRLSQIPARPTLRRLSFRQLHRPRPAPLPPALRTSPVPKIRHEQPNFQLCVGVHVYDMPRTDTNPVAQKQDLSLLGVHYKVPDEAVGRLDILGVRDDDVLVSRTQNGDGASQFRPEVRRGGGAIGSFRERLV